MGKIKWEALEEGDIVEVVAPASSSSKTDFKKAIRFLRDFGLTPRVPAHLFGNDVLCSNTDEKRFLHLKKAFAAKDSKVIWCMRGGYGSQRLLPRLSKLKIPKKPKLLVGYSDITALHNFIHYKWKWPSLHSTMLEEFGRGEGGKTELKDMRDILFGLKKKQSFTNLRPMNSAARTRKVLKAPVVGGNLAMICSSLGTPWAFDAKSKILALEDIGERGYRVDRMLVQLEQSGAFKNVRAVIFGDFVGGEENKDEDCVYLWREVQIRFAREAKFPVLKGLPVGHGPFQRPLPFNTSASLCLGPRASLSVSCGF